MTRDTQSFKGVSGGRSQVVEMIASSRLDYASSVIENAALLETLRRNGSEEMERPGSAVLPFTSDRMAVPEKGADFPLLHWIPKSWRDTMEKPDELLRNPAPSGAYPRMCLKAKRSE